MKLNDMHIIRHLRRDARANLTSISRKTGIPVSTIFDKLKVFENGVVKRFTAIVDFTKLGYPIRAKIFLRADPLHREALKHYLMAHDRVNNLFRINNGFDYSAECLFETIKEAEEFIDTLESQFKITSKAVYHVIDELAREKAICTCE
jgi:DNA-binding Lrp family transcriptional regulator